jgi:hypothetical protein
MAEELQRKKEEDTINNFKQKNKQADKKMS